MTKFNGHRSWNAWNVSLWINNDEGLYHEACDLAKTYGIGVATNIMFRQLQGTKTPDGAKYNKTSIREAMKGIL